MYIVKNVSSYEVRLADLRIALKPGQEQDLDLICSRFVADQSGSLKGAISRNEIKIMCRDGIHIKMKPFEHAAATKNDEVIQEMRELEKRINERQDALIRKNLAGGKQIDDETMGALQSAIKALQGIATTGSTEKPQQKQSEIAVPDDKVVDIQKRMIDRVSKDTKSNIKSSDSKEKSDINKNVDELGDLLG